MIRTWQHWSFSFILLAAYLGIFHLWLKLGHQGIVASGILASGVLGGLLLQAALRGYFANGLDLFTHAVVILDVLVEAILIPLHEGLSFYGCAAGFALVIGVHRSYHLRRPARLL
jgi:hypothetical protein